MITMARDRLLSSASQRRSNRIRCSRRAELRELLAVQRGGTRAADRGIRNRLSDGTSPVHVDQLRRHTLQTTKSLVTRRFNSFAASGQFRQRRLPGIEVSRGDRSWGTGSRRRGSHSRGTGRSSGSHLLRGLLRVVCRGVDELDLAGPGSVQVRATRSEVDREPGEFLA